MAEDIIAPGITDYLTALLPDRDPLFPETSPSGRCRGEFKNRGLRVDV